MARLLTILVFILDVLAIIDVWQRESSTEKKLLWTAVIILVPGFGALAWYLVSRKIINL